MPTSGQLARNARQTKRQVQRRPYKILALDGCPLKKAIVYKVAIITPRKPNSARRKIVKLRVASTRKRVFANIPGQGHNLQEYSDVIIRGGSAKDLPGVPCSLIKGKLSFSIFEVFNRKKRRSKFGLKDPNKQDRTILL